MGRLKVLFLDIDGVMQPDYEVSQAAGDPRRIRSEAAESAGDETLLEVGADDVAAVLLDWRQEAVDAVRSICEQSGAKVVVHSSWRLYVDEDHMRALMGIRGLDDLFLANAPRVPWDKSSSILIWLSLWRDEVTGYVVLDDQPLPGLGRHLVLTHGTLGEKDVPAAVSALGIPVEYD